MPNYSTVTSPHELHRKYLVSGAKRIYDKYVKFYGPELVKGAELLIAEEVADSLNAVVVSGIIHTDNDERPHYWCVKDNTVLDPVFDALRTQGIAGRKEVTDGGVDELKRYIERYRTYQI